MTNRSSLLALLTSRVGQWVPRTDIDFVGGHDARRRMGEIREQINKGTEYRLEERRDRSGRHEYRLVALTVDDSIERRQWRCRACHSTPSRMPMASMDPRWRLGRCVYCRNAKAIYERVVTP